ncbi:MAG: class I SAM-dependent methyltransferase [Pseudomonadota bacterium]
MMRRSFWRPLRRRLALGLPTVLGLARRGFFIPYRYAGMLEGRRGRDTHPVAAALLAAEQDAFAAALDALADFTAAFAAIAADRKPGAPRFDQDWFPRLDAAMAYAMVRQRRPRRLVEIGSGHSTRFFARAVADGGLDTVITAIDANPRADISRLPITVLRELVPRCGFGPFEILERGDLLSIDASHILMPGTDVDFMLCTVLPRLPAGAVVQIHDIFLPDGYPAEWAWRGYNEQLGIAALVAGGGWRPLFSSHWVVSRMADRVARSAVSGLPLVPGARESSLWLERRG